MDNMDDVQDSGTDEAVEVARLLLRFPGADPDVRLGSTSAGLLPYSKLPLLYPEGAMALHMAAQASLHEAALLEALLAGGAAVDAQDARGGTPLMYAASYSLHLARCLLDAGASPLLRSNEGICALEQAASWKNSVVARASDRGSNFTWAMRIVRTDVPLRPRRKSFGARSAEYWHFVAGEVDMAPLIIAPMLTRIYTADGYPQDASLQHAADVAEAVHGADAVVTRMLRLAQAGVPPAWSRGAARGFPPPFRAVVRTLLLCRACRPQCSLRGLDDALFDAIVARLARLDVWPTLRCVAGGLEIWWEDFVANAVVEDASVFDFTTQST
jgi:hypothetical protein